jgi:hypothetical protein
MDVVRWLAYLVKLRPWPHFRFTSQPAIWGRNWCTAGGGIRVARGPWTLWSNLLCALHHRRMEQ